MGRLGDERGANLVCSIIPLPNAVVLEEISRQGILPTVAPVNPYTLFALICTASKPFISRCSMLNLLYRNQQHKDNHSAEQQQRTQSQKHSLLSYSIRTDYPVLPLFRSNNFVKGSFTILLLLLSEKVSLCILS